MVEPLGSFTRAADARAQQEARAGCPTVELAERYRRTVDSHESRKGKSDEENDSFVDDVLEPLERELAKATPTTRAGVVALLDIALDKDYPGAPTGGAHVLFNNARDALAGAAPGAMEPINDPIFGLIATLRETRAAAGASDAISGKWRTFTKSSRSRYSD